MTASVCQNCTVSVCVCVSMCVNVNLKKNYKIWRSPRWWGRRPQPPSSHRESKKDEVVETESRFDGYQGLEGGRNCGDVGQRVQILSYKMDSVPHGDYS